MLFQVSTGASSSLNAAGRNALVTSFIICCGFITCWSFSEIDGILSFIGYTIDPSGLFYRFSVMMILVNSCINPFIYAAKYHEFQAGIRRLRAQVNPSVQAIAASFEVEQTMISSLRRCCTTFRTVSVT